MQTSYPFGFTEPLPKGYEVCFDPRELATIQKGNLVIFQSQQKGISRTSGWIQANDLNKQCLHLRYSESNTTDLKWGSGFQAITTYDQISSGRFSIAVKTVVPKGNAKPAVKPISSEDTDPFGETSSVSGGKVTVGTIGDEDDSIVCDKTVYEDSKGDWVEVVNTDLTEADKGTLVKVVILQKNGKKK